MDFDPYKSSYGRPVSGKWLDPPVVFVVHGVNLQFHYWRDIIDHLAPPRYKQADGPLAEEAPAVLKNKWVTPEEKMDETYLNYILTEKKYGVDAAREALSLVSGARKVMNKKDFDQVYQLFYRTYLTARVYEATAAAYFGFRTYARGPSFRSDSLIELLKNSLNRMLQVAVEIESYQERVPVGQWKWKNDAVTAREYYQKITVTGWKDIGNITFSPE
jgi:hypothetical protein